MKDALIIGATSDVAKAIAFQLAGSGTELTLMARDHQALDTLANDIQIRFGVAVNAVQIDLLDQASHKKAVDGLSSLPEVTFFLAGYLGDQSNAENDWEEASRILHSNFVGAVSILNLLANKYEEEKSGVLAVFGSVAGDRGRQSNFLYGSAKAGLAAYLSGLRNRLSKSGVHVMTVKPGFMATKMTEDLELPGILTAQPDEVAKSVIAAVRRRKNTIYVKWFWRYIMLIIKLIPEGVFKKLKL